MDDPLSAFPSLIPAPVPSSSRSPAVSGKSRRDTLEDRFATLFEPPTPRASPSGGGSPIFPVEQPTAPAPVPARPGHRSRAPSTADSDFGDFVSVPVAEAPLAPSPPRVSVGTGGAQAGAGSDAWATRQSLDFFESLGRAARDASERNRRNVLDELIAHEDDPLGFLSAADGREGTPGAVSGAATPSKPASPAPRPVSPARAATEPSLLDRTLGMFDQADPSGALADARSTHQSRASPSPSPSPSLPQDLSRRHSRQNTSSPGGSLSFSARWMPALLSRGPSTGGPAREAAAASFTPSPHLSSSPPALAGESPKGSPTPGASLLVGTLSRAAASTLSAVVGTPAVASPPRENPFAAHVYVPPSGAPGFAGDHAWNKGFEFDAASADVSGLSLTGRKDSTTPVLTPALAQSLRAHLPALARLPRTWNLLYSLDQHGISLRTLYTRSGAHVGPALLAVQSAAGGVFGACVGEGVHLRPGAYYGGGESFLWRAEDGAPGAVRVWKWTGRNDYVALCETDSISFGGGDGHYGLFLDDALCDGSSAQCPTFGNEPLCVPAPGTPLRGGEARFECVGVEVWAVGP